MEFSVNDQSFIFLICILCGVVVGFTFDIFRIIRRAAPSGKIATSIEDIIYWLITSAVVFMFILYANSGELRWFTFFGVFAGASVYLLTLSKFIIKFCLIVISVIKKIISVIIKILIIPIAFVCRLFKKPLFLVFRFSRRGMGRIRFTIVENTRRFKRTLNKI